MDHSFQEHIWMFKVVFVVLIYSKVFFIVCCASPRIPGCVYCDVVLRFSLVNITVLLYSLQEHFPLQKCELRWGRGSSADA